MRLLLFIMLLFTPLTSSQVLAQENYKEVNPDKLEEILQSKKGQKSVLLVYASWCPHCQIIFPELINIEKQNPGSVQAISMNKDTNRFVRFLNQFPGSTIEPYIWNKEYHLGISLLELGIDFSGYIPFIALIDESGNPIKQGHVTSDEIKKFLR
jgi:thiol-disulfide isomerase/thioredoxin